MGMLYYDCKGCKGCIGIFGHFVGFIRCNDCNLNLDSNPENYKDSKFQLHIVRCPTCSFTVTFESMSDDIECRCIKCDCKMHEGIPTETKQNS